MFFKSKKIPKKPSKEQVEQYGDSIYSILSSSSDASVFDKLVCDSFTYFWMIEKSGQSNFLTANPIAKVDAIIATAYINAMRFMRGVCDSGIKLQYSRIYFKKNIQVIRHEYPQFSSFIDEMFSSRIKLYNSASEKYSTDHHSIMDIVFEELQYVLSFDKVEQIYKPYTVDSPLIILELSDHMVCKNEIMAYKKVYDSIYIATTEQINQVLISLDKENVFARKDNVSIRFKALKRALFEGLAEYISAHPSQILTKFHQSLDSLFSSFLNEKASEKYCFSISVQNDESIEYVEFNFEEYVLEVTCGGSTSSPDFGFESYTNWYYIIWNDGAEKGEEIPIESFHIIYEILSSVNSRLTIESPDKFYYYPEIEELQTDNVEEQQEKLTKIDKGIVDIPTLWDMDPSYHGRKVRVYGRLWFKQTDEYWCTLYAEHTRKYSVVDRVELNVNLLNPLPRFLWKRPRIYTTEIPILGTLVYDHADGSYGLMDALYDEYWRDANGNFLCRGLECLHDCTEQCPIHCNRIARTLIDDADYSGAIKILLKATEKTLDYIDNWLTLATCYFNLSMYEEAEDLYYRVLKIDPKNIHAIHELGILSLRMGKIANAKKYASIDGNNKNRAQSLQHSQLIYNEILQHSNCWPSYTIPDAVWDLIHQNNPSVYWDMVLVQKLTCMSFVESTNSTLDCKRQWQELKNSSISTSVANMRDMLKKDGIKDAETMCILDLIAAYEREYTRY